MLQAPSVNLHFRVRQELDLERHRFLFDAEHLGHAHHADGHVGREGAFGAGQCSRAFERNAHFGQGVGDGLAMRARVQVAAIGDNRHRHGAVNGHDLAVLNRRAQVGLDLIGQVEGEPAFAQGFAHGGHGGMQRDRLSARRAHGQRDGSLHPDAARHDELASRPARFESDAIANGADAREGVVSTNWPSTTNLS